MKSFKEFLTEAAPESHAVSRTLFNKNKKNLSKGKTTRLFSLDHDSKNYEVHMSHDHEGTPEQIQIHHEGKPIGYMDSKIDTKNKKFKEGNTALHPDHQGKGLMGHVYHKFVQHGYAIHSDTLHSTGATKMWDKLGSHSDVEVSSDKDGLVARKK